ncbi:MAG: acetyl-CoA C-acyltransferase [Acidobacteriota bacterium]|jgi:acetyl-CoA acetyltransferase family protein
MKKEIWILGGARTPFGEYNGKLRGFTEIELGAHAARAALERSEVEPTEIRHVVMGNALQTSGNAIYGARHVALKAGVPVDVPALTVNRICGSGIQSIVTAAQLVELEEAPTVLAGGMESMSQAPHVIRGARTGFRLGQGKLEDSLMVALMDEFCGFYMAQTSDNVARKAGIGREQMDAYALRSQQAAERADRAGKFAEEIAPITLKSRKGDETFAADDHRRPDTTLDGLAKLPTAFGKDGMVTAGNASGIVDGAAAVVVMDADHARKSGRRPLGRIIAWDYAGVEPAEMGIGPVPSCRGAMKKAGLSLGEIDLVEINEAFAGQYLAVEKELELDRDKTNVNGGSIAVGHPLGATGTRLVLTLLLELKRRGGKFGLASACIGGGQGIAIIVESL